MFIDLEPVFNNDAAVIEIAHSFTLDDEEFAGDINVAGTVFNKTGIVRIDSKAKFDYSTCCALCGKPILRHATVPVKHILVTHLDSEEDTDTYIVVDNMRLDVEQLVSEDIYLSLPARFLCKEDCKGLCCMCGKDLNEGPCSCKKITDSRWDALKSLTEE